MIGTMNDTTPAGATPRSQSSHQMRSCGNCRAWQLRDNRWGRCLSERLQALVDGEGPLMTRNIFACRLWRPLAPAAAAGTIQ